MVIVRGGTVSVAGGALSVCAAGSVLATVGCGEAAGDPETCGVEELVFDCCGVLIGKSKFHPNKITAERRIAITKRCFSIMIQITKEAFNNEY